ncbi:hypothetical protein AB0H82_35655 [Streptomyces sp. NPDC050732]|uniref:hypothetical protein n=1 Tax=Streptomyces sp. NPDC050732 TaxID=3154632 RepID=UPI0034206F75
MVRNVLGSILALAGATAAVWSPFRAWYDGRPGRDFRIGELFSGGGVTGADAELFGSLFLPFAFAALLTLIGLALRSRLLVALAGVLVLGFTVLWMVRQGQAQGSLAVAGDGSGLGLGVLLALGGGVVLLLAAALMAGRRRRRGRARGRRAAPDQETDHPYPTDPYPADPYPTDPYPADPYPTAPYPTHPTHPAPPPDPPPAPWQAPPDQQPDPPDPPDRPRG